MIDVGIMIEGQNGLNWHRWKEIVKAVEEAGFSCLFRSDHFTNSKPPDIDALELWISLTWLAGNTNRLEFGPLVTPTTFRQPAHTARMAAAVDDLSGGRLNLGLGAGWQKREHEKFGFETNLREGRFDRFEEGVQVINRLLQSDRPVDFAGQYFNLKEAVVLPRPQRPGGPPIIIGGIGESRTLPVAAKYGNEWNALFINIEEFKRLNNRLDSYAEKYDKSPSEIRRSLMTWCIYGKTNAEVEKKIKLRTNGNQGKTELLKRGFVVGTDEEIAQQILTLGSAGAQRVMLQWLDLDDVDGLYSLGKGIIG